MTLLLLIGYASFVALVVVAVDWLCPSCRQRTLIVGAALPAPVFVTCAAAFMIAQIGPAAPDEIDAGGMAAMAFMFIGSIGSALLLIVGLLAGWLVARYLRGR
ncbi:MAG TPA: hypothetical protein VGB08_10050 [Allosphingosinicella sp.]